VCWRLSVGRVKWNISLPGRDIGSIIETAMGSYIVLMSALPVAKSIFETRRSH